VNDIPGIFDGIIKFLNQRMICGMIFPGVFISTIALFIIAY
jgi:hypothetical protein